MEHDTLKDYICRMLILAGALALAICVFFIFFNIGSILSGLGTIMGILTPFIYGAVIAYLLRPIAGGIERLLIDLFTDRGKKTGKACGLARPLSVFMSVVIAVVTIAAFLGVVIPGVIDSIVGLVSQVQTGFANLSAFADEILGDENAVSEYLEEFSVTLTENLGSWIQSWVLPNLEQLISTASTGFMSLFNILYNLLIGTIVAIYLLMGRKKFAAQACISVYAIFKEKWADVILDEVRFADRMFNGFLSGKIIDSLIIGIICFVFNLIAGIPNALLISVIVGVTNIIPFFGPFIGAIPSALLILLTAPVKCVIFLIFILVLQQFDGNILSPRILGNVTGLPSFWVLFSILFFGGLYGVVGMVIAVPLFAVIYDIIKKLIVMGLKKRGKVELLEQYRKTFAVKSKKKRKNSEAAPASAEAGPAQPPEEQG